MAGCCLDRDLEGCTLRLMTRCLEALGETVGRDSIRRLRRERDGMTPWVEEGQGLGEAGRVLEGVEEWVVLGSEATLSE